MKRHRHCRLKAEILPILAGLESDDRSVLKDMAPKSLQTLRRDLCKTWKPSPDTIIRDYAGCYRELCYPVLQFFYTRY